MNNDILALASAANEASFAFRDAVFETANIETALTAATRLCAALDALTGAIVEEANRMTGVMRPLQVGDAVMRRRVIRWPGKVVEIDGPRARVTWQPFDQTGWYDISDDLVGPHNTGRHQ